MRSISLINHLEFNFNGSVVRKGITLGDVDNDGNYELIVGNETGDVAIFKALDCWQTISNLGFVSCVVVGDVLNQKRNCLVIVTADGWCFIYSAEENGGDAGDDVDKISENMESLIFSTESNCSSRSGSIAGDGKEEPRVFLKRIHAQRIPPNTKDILLGDIDGDGAIEMVLGLTDRVVRSYRWVETVNDPTKVPSKPEIIGKLVALNKWECAQQIGSVSLHHSVDGIPSLLVAQPGGTFMRIKHQSVDVTEVTNSAIIPPSAQVTNLDQCDDHGDLENLTGFSVDYQFLGISRMRNSNISTEILGDLVTSTNSNDLDKESKSDEHKETQQGSPYAVATLDGTIMLVQDEIILWAIAVDHQLFALTKLDVTKNGLDEIIVCSWDGHTYILDQQKNTVRFQLNESVQAFEVGYYTLIPGSAPVTCFVYITFRNKILLYFDIPLKNMICKKFELPNLPSLQNIVNCDLETLTSTDKKDIVEYLLYGLKS
ncbi:KICSTOR complex protein ITFG2-like isoform X1 [Onthophagus taurus]|uniref:KICSTOR complex protein ITFG2-like isoform X1 n=1 Tax=Onthophagus taurus TaxID=166361 RepID=UPI0039BDDC11